MGPTFPVGRGPRQAFDEGKVRGNAPNLEAWQEGKPRNRQGGSKVAMWELCLKTHVED